LRRERRNILSCVPCQTGAAKVQNQPGRLAIVGLFSATSTSKLQFKELVTLHWLNQSVIGIQGVSIVFTETPDASE